MTAGADAFQLFGTRKTEVPPVRLSAGKLEVDVKDGNLRTVTYDRTEVLRAVSYLVRDRDWGTYAPSLSELKIDQGTDAFSVSYVASCHGPDETRLDIRVRISAEAGGPVIFDAEAFSDTGFETNRCGFCILHPIVGIAGEPVSVEHVDGAREDTRFPDLIEPWQPFKDMRAITHTVMPGVTAECRMEGDTFEMEDQRNWSDASYKTYVRPLALPWPYQLPAGEPVRQRIVLTITDGRPDLVTPAAAPSTDRIVTITPGTKSGTMPQIGLVITPEEADATLAAGDVLSAIGAQELLFHFDPNAGHGADAFRTFAALARPHAGTSTLEIALPCKRSPLAEAEEIAGWMQTAGFRPDAILISPSVDRQSTPPGSQWPECPPLEEVYAAARRAFPGIRLGGGMLSYFTELNRKRVPAKPLDFISHCTNPIVHAADDLSVMQTLEALPFITRSVRAIYGDKPYRIGPSTIPMRQNPYGSRTMDNPGGERIAMANTDPRHNARFAEAFALGYAASVLDAGLECLTLSALSGPFGLIAGNNEPSLAGGRRPLFHTVATLASLAGSPWRECVSSDPAAVMAFMATPAKAARQLVLVNITAMPQRLDLASFRLAGEPADGMVTLQPYATASLALAD
ncbi:hypothetical protein [Rhizobium sp. BK602]|uniref:D-apionate lactonase n=1 Tax=Rhizobium sp. BK602 TaxID=2586986 RepID=UPI00161D1C6C|nr:hypothetical protein [Rhizobium sp. BK602]MBB3609210.1 hypothetical protein [Rhizobium sp. BK602]